MTEMTETKKVEVPEGFMTGKFPLKKRAYGEEQPGIKVGPFKIRLPLIHHEWSWTEMAAAMFLGVACLGAGVTTTMTTFGLDDPANIAALGFDENGVFLMALTFGVLNAICYYLPSLLGDPVVPGWITPALPLTLKFPAAVGPAQLRHRTSRPYLRDDSPADAGCSQLPHHGCYGYRP